MLSQPDIFKKNHKRRYKLYLEKSGIELEVVLNNIQKTIINSICITDKEKGITRITHGMINMKETKEIDKLIKKESQVKTLTIRILHKIAKKVYEKIWIPRNKEAAKTKTKKIKETKEIKTVAGEISKKHNKETTERNTEIK